VCPAPLAIPGLKARLGGRVTVNAAAPPRIPGLKARLGALRAARHK